MFAPEKLRQTLLDHWLKHMHSQPEYITGAIKQHFEKSPWDREFLEAPLMAEYKRIKRLQ